MLKLEFRFHLKFEFLFYIHFCECVCDLQMNKYAHIKNMSSTPFPERTTLQVNEGSWPGKVEMLVSSDSREDQVTSITHRKTTERRALTKIDAAKKDHLFKQKTNALDNKMTCLGSQS